MCIIGVPKTSDYIGIKIKMQNPSQEPQAASKNLYQDLRDMDVLFTFKFKIKMPNPSQYPSASFKDQNADLKDMDILSTI